MRKDSLAEQFFAICIERFQFLVDEFGFKRRAKKAQTLLCELVYATKTTAVAIVWERRDQFLFVRIYQLADTKFDRDSLWKYPGLNLDTLINLRAPHVSVQQDLPGEALSMEAIDQILRQYAKALRAYGSDMLSGEFHTAPEIKQLIEQSAGAISRALDDLRRRNT